MRSLLQASFLGLAVLAVGIVAVAGVIISSLVGFLFWRVYRSFAGVLAGVPDMLAGVASLHEQTEADWGSKGGLARVANTQATKMLSFIEQRIFDSTIPFGELIRFAAKKLDLPLDQWITEMPWGLISLTDNPKFQKLLPGLQAGLAQMLQPKPEANGAQVQRAY